MPVATIVGTIDHLGYLFCVQCRQVDERGRWMDGRQPYGLVYSDASPHNVEPCEVCGENLDKYHVS